MDGVYVVTSGRHDEHAYETIVLFTTLDKAEAYIAAQLAASQGEWRQPCFNEIEKWPLDPVYKDTR